MRKRFGPEYWERRAKEARAVASQFADSESRAIMTKIADSYLKMADAAKGLQKSAARLGNARD